MLLMMVVSTKQIEIWTVLWTAELVATVHFSGALTRPLGGDVPCDTSAHFNWGAESSQAVIYSQAVWGLNRALE